MCLRGMPRRLTNATDNVALRAAITADLVALRAVAGDDREAMVNKLAALDARWA